MTARAEILRWLMGMMAIATIHFSQMGIMGIGKGFLRQLGYFIIVTMASYANLHGRFLFGRIFFMTAFTGNARIFVSIH